MKKITQPALLVLAMLCVSLTGFSQVYNINAGLISGCSGTLTDSGGETNSYSANENYICTLMPGIPGAELAMRLVQLQLGTGDTLWIHDGSNVSSPVIAVIDQNAWIGHSFFGAGSGSLTVRFKSNFDSSVGQFKFDFACNTCAGIAPSIAPNVAALRVCANTPVTLDASNSIIPEGASVQSAQWSIDGGAPVSGFPNATLEFTSSGVHYVALQLQLSNGCIAPMPLYVRAEVVEVPSAEMTATPDSVCVGQTVQFETSLPDFYITNSLMGEGGYIPDDQINAFSSSVNLVGSGAILTSINQIGGITLSAEHSYTSDITISLTCPNGQVMTLFDGASGGGIWLGLPVDNKTGDIGQFSQYTFDPTITTPLFGNTTGTTSAVVNSAGTAGTSFNPGNYAATGAWSSLIGCPVNGTWTLTIMDQAGADDGYVEYWELSLNGVSADGLDQGFQADIALDCSNLHWVGPASVNANEDCSSASFTAISGGLQLFLLQGTTLEGCAFTTSAFVKVFDPINAYVTTTDAIGGNTGSAQVHVELPVGTYSTVWSNGVIGAASVNSLAPGEYTVTIGDLQGCSDEFPFLINSDISVPLLLEQPLQIIYSTENQALWLLNGSNTPVEWKVFNAAGQVVAAGRNQGERTEVDMQPFATGVYVVALGDSRHLKFVRP